MQIKIKKKASLISHKMGSSFLVLKSQYSVQIFPGLLVFIDINTKKSFQIYLFFQGPVKNFTIIQDIENAQIKVFFHSKDGYFSYKILNKDKKFILYFENILNTQIKIKEEKIREIKTKEKIILPIQSIAGKPKEHLFFGIHKKSCMEDLSKRQDPMEFLPFIFLYAQYFENVKREFKNKSLFKILNEKIQRKEKNDLFELFVTIFNVHFSSAFIPQINDDRHQNVIPYIKEKINPISILQEFYLAIKSMLIFQNQNKLTLLSCLASDLHMGKALALKMNFGNVDIEWSKKILKKAIFRPSKNIQIKLILPSKIKSFRIREKLSQKGKILKNKQKISFEENKIYFLDRFQK